MRALLYLNLKSYYECWRLGWIWMQYVKRWKQIKRKRVEVSLPGFKGWLFQQQALLYSTHLVIQLKPTLLRILDWRVGGSGVEGMKWTKYVEPNRTEPEQWSRELDGVGDMTWLRFMSECCLFPEFILFPSVNIKMENVIHYFICYFVTKTDRISNLHTS